MIPNARWWCGVRCRATSQGVAPSGEEAVAIDESAHKILIKQPRHSAALPAHIENLILAAIGALDADSRQVAPIDEMGVTTEKLPVPIAQRAAATLAAP
jgi:hypothetical protein